jgi:hypothetical protein
VEVKQNLSLSYTGARPKTRSILNKTWKC